MEPGVHLLGHPCTPCLSGDALGERLPDAVVVVGAVESSHGGDARVGEGVGAQEPHHGAR